VRLEAKTPLAAASLAAFVQSQRAVAPTPQGLKTTLGEGQDPLDGLSSLFDRLEDLVPARPASPTGRL
jgi:hypothetical protein